MKKFTVSYQTAEGLKEDVLEMDSDIEVEDVDDDDGVESSLNEVIETDVRGLTEAKIPPQQVSKKEIRIVLFGNWPEYKTVMRTKTVAKILGKKIKTKVPVAYRRHSKLEVFVYIEYPTSWEQKLIVDAIDCAKKAAIGAVAVSIAGGAAAAYPVFAASFEICIKAKLGSYADEIGFGTDSRKVVGKWVPY